MINSEVNVLKMNGIAKLKFYPFLEQFSQHKLCSNQPYLN